MSCSFYALVVLFAGGLICAFMDGYERLAARVYLLTTFLGSFLLFSDALKVLSGGVPLQASVRMGFPTGIARFEIDALSALFLCMIAGFSAVMAIYMQGGMAPNFGKNLRVGKFFFFCNLLVASMVLAVTARNVIVFLIGWEVMALTSFFLILFNHADENTRKNAPVFLMYMHIGVLFLMAAFLLCVVKNGNGAPNGSLMDMAGIQTLMDRGGGIGVLPAVVFLLFLAGFGSKAALVPFHPWAPLSGLAAPHGASALLTGLAANMGIYGILRVISLMNEFPLWIGYGLLTVSVATGLYGIINCLPQNDMRKLLAYSGIANAGIIGIGISAGLIGLSYGIPQMVATGFTGVLLHTLNSTVFMGLLFCAAGSVAGAVHTNDINLMGGLFKRMPLTGFAFLAGAMSVCALPPFNGFVSLYVIYNGMITGLHPDNGLLLATMVLGIAGLALIGGLGIAVFTKAFGIAFLGRYRSSGAAQAVEPPLTMVIPMVFLCAVSLFTAIAPEMAMSVLLNPLKALVPGGNVIPPVVAASNPVETVTIVKSLSMNEALAVLVFLSIAGGLVLLRYFLLANNNKKAASASSASPAWRCGYGGTGDKMQYTGSSFSAPLYRIASPLTCTESASLCSVDIPNEIFPPASASISNANAPLVHDPLERRLYLPIWRTAERVFGKLSRTQSQDTGGYALYLLVTLILLLVIYISKLVVI